MPAPDPAEPFPPRSSWLFDWFAWYCRGYLLKHFRGLRLLERSEGLVDRGGPLVVYLNHPSWWDPIVGVLLAQRLWPTRRHYAAMDRAALDSYPFFKKLGFFGVERHSAQGARRFLAQTRRILEEPDAVLWITPQGKFADVRERPVVLMSGLEHLIRRLDRGTVLPVALEYVFWDERLPEALVAFGEPIELGAGSVDAGGRLAHHLERAQDELAAAARSRDPARFRPLLEADSGMGNLYGRWRAWRRSAQRGAP